MSLKPAMAFNNAVDLEDPNKSAQSTKSRIERAAALYGNNGRINKEEPVVDLRPKAAPVAPEQDLSASVEEVVPTLEGQSGTSGEPLAESNSDLVEATESPKEESPLSTQHAILARKEKALRAKVVQQEQAFKAKEADLARREAELTSKSNTQIDTTKYISIEDLMRDPLGKLESLGMDYDAISERALERQSPDALARRQMREEFQEELRKVREEQDNFKKGAEDSQKQAYDQALNEYRREATHLVNSDPAYETIKETNSVKDVVDLIEATFKKDGVILTVEQAATAVEEYLIEEAIKLAKLNKVKARLTPAEQKQQAQAKPQQSSQAKPITTLTNSVGTSKQLTALERARLAFRGELK